MRSQTHPVHPSIISACLSFTRGLGGPSLLQAWRGQHPGAAPSSLGLTSWHQRSRLSEKYRHVRTNPAKQRGVAHKKLAFYTCATVALCATGSAVTCRGAKSRNKAEIVQQVVTNSKIPNKVRWFPTYSEFDLHWLVQYHWTVNSVRQIRLIGLEKQKYSCKCVVSWCLWKKWGTSSIY